MLKAALAAVLVIASAQAAEPPAGMVKTTKGRNAANGADSHTPA